MSTGNPLWKDLGVCVGWGGEAFPEKVAAGTKTQNQEAV